jgi:serine/threonine-protein kinase
VAFFAEGKLKKVPLAGGPPLTLSDAKDAAGGAWGPDGTIVFSAGPPGGLWRVPAAGGSPSRWTQPDAGRGELGHEWPQFLPDGTSVLFTAWSAGGLEKASLAVASLERPDEAARVVVEGATYGRYAPTGQLVFARKSRLMAAPFDLRRLAVAGEPVALLDGVSVDWFTGAAQYALSDDGVLVYAPGGHAVPGHRLELVDHEGRRELVAEGRPFMNVAAAHGAKRVAVTIHEGIGSDVWSADLERGSLTRLTFEGHNIEPALSPDGRRVALCATRNGPYNVFWAAADGSGAPEPLLAGPRNRHPISFTPDGRSLVFGELSAEGGSDVWLVPLDGSDPPRRLLATRFREQGAVFSPDGRYLAYASDESDRYAVYLRPWPELSPRWPVSIGTGLDPAWSPDGRTLYYRGEKSLEAVSVEPGPEPRIGRPRLLFPLDDVIAWDVVDARRFVVVRGGPGAARPQLNVVLDWLAEWPATSPSS